jgi:eukaryotic-like serine/threonine-protein kinase
MTDMRSRWPQVKEIFHAALACAPDRRAAFVRGACGGDAALSDEVESLLASHAEAGSFAEGAAIDATTSRDGRALVKGAVLGPYQILEPLDAGGMGEVYRALDTRLHREVAVKVLPAAFASGAAHVARLADEARLLAALNHPHIATIHGFEIAGDVHAMIMELVEGPTLAARLSTGPLKLDVALEIACQIASALEAAHEKGIIHRDLKPANIKLTATGAAKVLDFGLARTAALALREAEIVPAVEEASRERLVAGTPGYMAPEQARGERVDARSDIWAFGCVVYEMLTAQQAFGRTAAGKLPTTVGREPDWQCLPSDLPLGIRRLLRRCLEADPDRRLHHITDARLEIEDARNDADSRDLAEATRPSRRRARRLGASTAALALVLAGMLTAWAVRRTDDAPELRVAEIATPRTSDLSSFALSPDGRRLAFVADHEGESWLWIRELDSAEARPLPGTERARRPFWSPDSRSIGFFRDSELKRIEPRGGSAQTVTYLLAGTTAAWGPDGTILFSSTASRALRRINAAGGNIEQVTAPAPESTGHRHPQFLPGGRDFLFFAGGPDAVRGVYLGALGSPAVTRLVSSDTQGAYVAPGWLLFIRQGTLLAQAVDLVHRTVSGEPVAIANAVAFEPIDGTGAFSTSEAGVMAYRAGRSSITRLTWFDRSGQTLGTLGSLEQVGLSNFRLSPDDRRVAVERSLQNETDVWLLDATRRTRLTHASNGRLMRLPLWSPDGSRITFQSVRPGSIGLSVQSSAGDEAEDVLFESPEVKVPSDWSPDGTLLMYYVPNPTSGTDLWVLPRDTRVPFAFLKTEANELWGQFSPDGRWVAYQSNDTGRYEIYLRAFPSPGGPIPISTTGGVYPRWSRDGKELYFIAPDAKLMAVSIRTTLTSVAAGVPTALFQTRRLGGGANVIGRSHQYDVARDGRFLINIDAESHAPPVTLLMNWNPGTVRK